VGPRDKLRKANGLLQTIRVRASGPQLVFYPSINVDS
jgi:hypothetical protein